MARNRKLCYRSPQFLHPKILPFGQSAVLFSMRLACPSHMFIKLFKRILHFVKLLHGEVSPQLGFTQHTKKVVSQVQVSDISCQGNNTFIIGFNFKCSLGSGSQVIECHCGVFLKTITCILLAYRCMHFNLNETCSPE